MLVRRILLAVLAISIIACHSPSIARADSDRGGGPDENPDRATPQQAPTDTRPPAVADQVDDFTVFAATASAPRPFIDDFKYDKLVLEGTAREVCVGGLHTGSAWAYNEIVSRFGGTAGTMYYCRERWDTANNPDCNGQIANPVTTPEFFSTCWSNHARGRAIDVMVGRQGSGYNRTRGLNIVNWLLASDANGNVNANARKLGIQQILFDDRCWNSEGDRGIASWDAMRSCGIGHHDHIHIDLTLNGAYTNVSYWGKPPEVKAKLDTQVFWDHDANWREAISWFNLSARSEEGLAVPSQYDEIAVGDLDRDGLKDETFLWDKETGSWAVQNWNDGNSLTAAIGTWGRFYDEVYVGDFDVDGYLNDILFWDRDSGHYGVVSWKNYSPYAQSSGWFYPSWDGVYPADLDGNSVVNDLLLFDIQTGQWAAYRWDALRPAGQLSGYFPLGGDEIIVGDWSAGGNLDEIILWDKDNGNWRLYSFSAFWPTVQNSGWWNPAVDIAVAGDYDTDGRVDDLFVYVSATGEWAIRSYHRNVMTVRYYTSWGRGYDVISVGSFMD
jgi:hypothetical protein